MPVRTRPARATGFPDFFEFATNERTRQATLLGQAYFLQPPPGMEWDLNIVRRIRESFDSGLVPVHRVMVFQSSTGGEIKCHNWGIARFSLNGITEEPPWKQELLAKADKPGDKYLASLERPNTIDAWYPFVGMNAFGLPPDFQPLDEEAFLDLRERDAFRRSQKDEKDAFSAYMQVQDAKEAEKKKAQDEMFADVEGRFDERLHTTNTPSTSKVKATPAHLQIQE